MDRSSYKILIGGKAGEGVKKAAQVIAEILCAHGLHVVQTDDYQSLIRGGHSFSVVCCSQEELFATYETCELIICFDQRSIDEHQHQLASGGLLFYNSDAGSSETGIPLPLGTLMKKHYSGEAKVSLAAVAIFCALMDIPAEALAGNIKTQYKRNIDENIAYAKEIHAMVRQRDTFLKASASNQEYRYLSGNQAIALGAWTAGLDFYFGYPMTPASSLLHYIALKQASHKMYAIHAESELAAANMAIGAAMAGCRSAVGSSGGGFALMQEAFSLAGMAEVPLLCVLSSRPGPSTGVSTYSAQEDLWFALHQGHGEFPRVVASPDSIERAYSLAAELLTLAWQVQTPVILLTEKQLSEGMIKLVLDPSELRAADFAALECCATGDYERYAITENGISPLMFFGEESDPVIKWSSHEHLASGLRTDTAEEIIRMKDKRLRKKEILNQLTGALQVTAEYGEGDFLLFAYGSTVLELREAQKHCEVPFKIVALIYLEPFPEEALSLYRDQEAIVVEHSSEGGFTKFLNWKLGLKIKRSLLKYDGRAWDPIKLAKQLEEAFDA